MLQMVRQSTGRLRSGPEQWHRPRTVAMDLFNTSQHALDLMVRRTYLQLNIWRSE
jgi:hypothetical protein